MANSITPSLENRSTLSIFLSVSLFLSVILISKRRYVQQSLDDFFPPIRLTASPPPKQLHSSDPDISREPNSVVIDAESEQPPVSVEAKNIVEIVVDSAGDEDVTSEREKAMRESLKDCDLYMGSWVRDEGYPIYTPGSCEYVDEAFDCQNNARPDSDYLHWRWKPHGCDLPREGVRVNGRGNSNPTLSIDKVDKTSKKWKRADIIVFNTGHWWNHRKTSRGVYYYKEGEYIYPHLDANEAYRRALQTWGRWIDQNLNTTRQLVFYRGYSSPHFRGGEWDSGGSCYNEKEPILSEQESIVKSYPFKMKVLEEVIKGMKFPVRLLNVTRLTNFRKDGHPSVYRKNRITRSSSKRAVQDCSHWCLPGVPDAWNELIYANLILK
ncbi:Protein trichome birefringence-like 5 [Linum perenne]